jgi:L-seryl-tRNA(Ser) seleniumtransferase
VERIPVWRMIAADQDLLKARAGAWAEHLQAAGLPAAVWAGQSTVGGGSLPGETLPTSLVALPTLPADRLSSQLRAGNPPIIARIAQDAVCLDPRTVLPEEDDLVVAGVQRAWRAAT